ncbi:MAG: sensor histidine kinase [Spirulina sp.]
MFSQIRRQLIISYLVILAAILSVFTIAIRLTFTKSLHQRLVQDLKEFAQLASEELEEEDELAELETEHEDSLEALTVPREITVQWFDRKGKLLAQIGKNRLNSTLDRQPAVQTIYAPQSLKIIVFPVISAEDGDAIAYVRVARDLEDLEKTIQHLDWGLGMGLAIALGLSGAGGLFLTRKAMKPIEESYRRLQQFTADASHELRSPLMAIKTNAAVALKYSQGMREGDFEKFSAIASASKQLTHMTEDLLILARLDRKVKTQKQPINLTELLQSLLTIYDARAMEKGLDLIGHLEADLEIVGDEVLLFRLFVNLLENALRYTPEKGKIQIDAKREEDKILVRVEDTGIGISPEDCDRIFDRFWQADRARSYQSEGVGLGLAIAREIARTHAGDISVSSILEQGTCFTVSLPVVPKSRTLVNRYL